MGSILDNSNQIMITVDVVGVQTETEVRPTSSSSNCNRLLAVPGGEEVVPTCRDNFWGSEGPNLIFAQLPQGDNSGVLGLPKGGWVVGAKMPNYPAKPRMFHGLTTQPPP